MMFDYANAGEEVGVQTWGVCQTDDKLPSLERIISDGVFTEGNRVLTLELTVIAASHSCDARWCIGYLTIGLCHQGTLEAAVTQVIVDLQAARTSCSPPRRHQKSS